MIDLNPGDFKAVTIMFAEWRFSAFSKREYMYHADCSRRTAERRFEALLDSGYLTHFDGEYRLNADADYSTLLKLSVDGLDEPADDVVHSKNPENSNSNETLDDVADDPADDPADDVVQSKKAPPEDKNKTSQTLKRKNSNPPSKNPHQNSPSGTKKEPPKSENQTADAAIGDYLPELLETFGFDHDFGTVSRLTMRIINSDLEESEYRDYLTDQLYTLSEEVENGDQSRKMAQKLIGSTKSVKWYKENKAPTQSGQTSDSIDGGSYGIEVGKNDYDGSSADNSALFDEYTPEQIIELAFEMGEDPTDYRPDVFEAADLDTVDPDISAAEFDRMLEQYRESKTGIPPDIDQQIA